MKDSCIYDLACHSASRYRPPCRETIYTRDWDNQHVIFEIQQGKILCNTRSPGTYEEEFNLEKRMLVANFLETYVLDASMSCSLPFDLNMHDFVATSMNTDTYPHSILSPCILEDDPINIPIPDFYAMVGYHGALTEPDLMPYEHKVNRLYFIGNSTGHADPSRNQRILLCRYAQQYSWIDAYISGIVQMRTEDLYHYDPYSSYYQSPYIPMKYQKMYRHLMSVDGNTAAWDRIPWILASNSILWKQQSPHICWYYPYLQPWVHYIPFELPTLETTWKEVQGKEKELRSILEHAHGFVEDFLTIEKHALYMKLFLLEVIERYAP